MGGLVRNVRIRKGYTLRSGCSYNASVGYIEEDISCVLHDDTVLCGIASHHFAKKLKYFNLCKMGFAKACDVLRRICDVANPSQAVASRCCFAKNEVNPDEPVVRSEIDHGIFPYKYYRTHYFI